MAGVKGRSGGARPNSGPKPRTKDIGAVLAKAVIAQAEPAPVKVVAKQEAPVAPAPAPAPVPTPAVVAAAPTPPAPPAPPAPVVQGAETPLEFLLAVMNNPMVEDRLRLDAAKTAAQYMHLKKGDGGIKEEKAEKAKKAAAGKFGAAAPPKLVAVNGR